MSEQQGNLLYIFYAIGWDDIRGRIEKPTRYFTYPTQERWSAEKIQSTLKEIKEKYNYKVVRFSLIEKRGTKASTIENIGGWELRKFFPSQL